MPYPNFRRQWQLGAPSRKQPSSRFTSLGRPIKIKLPHDQKTNQGISPKNQEGNSDKTSLKPANQQRRTGNCFTSTTHSTFLACPWQLETEERGTSCHHTLVPVDTTEDMTGCWVLGMFAKHLESCIG